MHSITTSTSSHWMIVALLPHRLPPFLVKVKGLSALKHAPPFMRIRLVMQSLFSTLQEIIAAIYPLETQIIPQQTIHDIWFRGVRYRKIIVD